MSDEYKQGFSARMEGLGSWANPYMPTLREEEDEPEKYTEWILGWGDAKTKTTPKYKLNHH